MSDPIPVRTPAVAGFSLLELLIATMLLLVVTGGALS